MRRCSKLLNGGQFWTVVLSISAGWKPRVETIPHEAEDALVAWDWPGNIRELEAVMERAVLRSSGRSLDLGPNELKQGRHDRERDPGKQ